MKDIAESMRENRRNQIFAKLYYPVTQGVDSSNGFAIMPDNNKHSFNLVKPWCVMGE